MNRTALGVVALAVGAILILGLYNIYKPQTNSMVHDVFGKVDHQLSNTTINYMYNGKFIGSQKVGKYSSIVKKPNLNIPKGYAYYGNDVHTRPNHSVNVDLVKAQKKSAIGMTYLDDGCGHITVVGFDDNTNWTFNFDTDSWANRPNDLRTANSVKFDTTVHANNGSLCGLFSTNDNLKSIDLGDNFYTENATEFVSMFEHNRNLTYLNLGPHFSTKSLGTYDHNPGVMNMFLGDNNLKSLHGNVPKEVQQSFNHKASPYPGSFEKD